MQWKIIINKTSVDEYLNNKDNNNIKINNKLIFGHKFSINKFLR